MQLSKTQPAWHKKLAAEKQGLWTAGDSKFALAGQAFWSEPVRVVLKDGTVLDGTVGDERNRWDPKHALALRMPGRKSQKWVPVKDVAVVWGDKGPKLEDLLTEYIVKGRA